jgi:hypothetical protein
MSKKSDQDLILEVLSFYDPMTYAQIIFELDSDELKMRPHLNQETLPLILKALIKAKKVKVVEGKGEVMWQRTLPSRHKSWWRRILSFWP